MHGRVGEPAGGPGWAGLAIAFDIDAERPFRPRPRPVAGMIPRVPWPHRNPKRLDAPGGVGGSALPVGSQTRTATGRRKEWPAMPQDPNTLLLLGGLVLLAILIVAVGFVVRGLSAKTPPPERLPACNRRCSTRNRFVPPRAAPEEIIEQGRQDADRLLKDAELKAKDDSFRRREEFNRELETSAPNCANKSAASRSAKTPPLRRQKSWPRRNAISNTCRRRSPSARSWPRRRRRTGCSDRTGDGETASNHRPLPRTGRANAARPPGAGTIR